MIANKPPRYDEYLRPTYLEAVMSMLTLDIIFDLMDGMSMENLAKFREEVDRLENPFR